MIFSALESVLGQILYGKFLVSIIAYHFTWKILNFSVFVSAGLQGGEAGASLPLLGMQVAT